MKKVPFSHINWQGCLSCGYYDRPVFTDLTSHNKLPVGSL
jgi:hypothetical protein